MFKKIAAASLAMAVSAQSFATATNLPSDYQTTMDTVSSDLALVGGGLVGLALVSLGFRWIKGAIFG